MSENNDSNELLGLTEKIVSSHVANNAVSNADLPDLIKAVHTALTNITTAGEAAPTPKPVVPIKRSVTPNYIVCLEDGKKFKMLKRHLKTDHSMTPRSSTVGLAAGWISNPGITGSMISWKYQKYPS